MSDFDDDMRAAGERMRDNARELAATSDPLPADRTGTGAAQTGRRRIAALVGVVAVLGLGIAGLVVVDRRGTGRVDDGTVPSPTDVGTTPVSAPDPVTSTTPSPTHPSTTSSEPATTAPTTTDAPEPAPLTRPLVDPDVCTPLSAIDDARTGLPRDPESSLPLTLFARPSALPIPIQVIGAEVDGPAKPFAMVLRHFDSSRPADGAETVDVNGEVVGLTTYPDGNAMAVWNLPDGSQGYLRARGLSRDDVVAVLTGLSPRAADAPVPGFDYTAPTGTATELELVTERINTAPVDGRYAGSQCRVPSTGLVYRVSAFAGEPVYVFGGVIDRPTPLDVGMAGESAVTITGIADPSAPTVADVTMADEAEWRRLLLEPDAMGDAHLAGPDTWATVELVPIDDTSTPVSRLSLRIDERDGVAFLEVDMSQAVVADEAEYWKIEVDGRIRLRATAGAGDQEGTAGTRLGDTPWTTPITVRVSTTDGDDFTIQTTGEFTLEPTPAR